MIDEPTGEESRENKRPAEGLGGCFATDSITVEGRQVWLMVREPPANESDSGWRFFAVGESEECANDPAFFQLHDLNTITNHDADIIAFLNSPVGSALRRDNAGDFEPVPKDYPLIPGFIVRTGEQSTYRHVQGGKRAHEGAVCPTCRRPLARIWQLDCSDPRISVSLEGRKAFGDLANLPLYYCWPCAGEIAYQVIGPDSIEIVFSHARETAADFPYENYPVVFPERPLRLYCVDDLPPLVRAAARRSFDLDESIPAETTEALQLFLGREIKYSLDVWWHTFGGEPWLVQGPEELSCPNSRCPRHNDGGRMKILTAVGNDPLGGLPMIESVDDVIAKKGRANIWVQVVFHICDHCLTIHADNRCD